LLVRLALSERQRNEEGANRDNGRGTLGWNLRRRLLARSTEWFSVLTRPPRGPSGDRRNSRWRRRSGTGRIGRRRFRHRQALHGCCIHTQTTSRRFRHRSSTPGQPAKTNWTRRSVRDRAKGRQSTKGPAAVEDGKCGSDSPRYPFCHTPGRNRTFLAGNETVHEGLGADFDPF